MRKTIYILDELVKAIDDLRSRERPVLSFSAMLSRIVRRGLSISRVEPTARPIIRFCDECGRELPLEGCRFCDQCGREILAVI